MACYGSALLLPKFAIKMSHSDVKGQAIRVQAWTDPEGSRRLGRFGDNRHMKVGRLSALRTSRLYPPGNVAGINLC